jgi:GNAT superfamily N-acetyltransferase
MTQLLYSAVMGMTRIKAIAVDERLRRNGIGGALLLRCWQIFERNGYMLIFGQADDSPALSRFFRRHGFVMLEPDSGFDPWVVVGVHADVRPDVGQRTFMWRRGHHGQVAAPRSRPRGGRDGQADASSGSHHRTGQSLHQEERPLALVNSGTVPLVIAAAEDPRTAPLSLVAAAACQAGHRASAEARARLHHVVAAALRHLGFHAQVFAAQVTAWREDKPDDALVTVTAAGSHAATDSMARGHTMVWTKSFGALVDVVAFFDDRVRDLAADGLQELIASPAILPLASLEPFVAAGAMPAIERGPIRIGWQLFGAGGTPRAHETDADAIRRGGEVLADAAIDLLLAADCYVDLAPMHTRFPHLRAVMTQRGSRLWATAGDR